MERLIAILFLSREVTHRLHLMTDTYAHHMALGDFYDEILDLADQLAEVHQGMYGQFTEIPYLDWSKDYEDTKAVMFLKAMFEKHRMVAIKEDDTQLQNVADEVCALFSRTIYKLKFLK